MSQMNNARWYLMCLIGLVLGIIFMVVDVWTLGSWENGIWFFFRAFVLLCAGWTIAGWFEVESHMGDSPPWSEKDD